MLKFWYCDNRIVKQATNIISWFWLHLHFKDDFTTVKSVVGAGVSKTIVQKLFFQDVIVF